MDDPALGRRFRALRHRLGWRQRDAGDRAGVSQDLVSLVERGRIEDVSVRSLRALARAVGGELRLDLWFRGGELDRLLDEGHASLVGAIVARLEGLGWECRPEVSFAVFAERGSIDVVAWHPATRTLLVIEVKTELVSVEETLRRHDVKVRLAADVVRSRFGWQPRAVARLLVLPDGSTPRRQVARRSDVMRRAYPLMGSALRRWLERPDGSVAGLVFLADTTHRRATRPAVSRRRIRRRREVTSGPGSGEVAATHEPASSLPTMEVSRGGKHEPAS